MSTQFRNAEVPSTCALVFNFTCCTSHMTGLSRRTVVQLWFAGLSLIGLIGASHDGCRVSMAVWLVSCREACIAEYSMSLTRLPPGNSQTSVPLSSLGASGS
eukprot:2596992-Amphidinium_carterae.1